MAEEEEIAGEHEMSFIDHLEELRWHIVRALASIVVFAVGAFMAKTFVFHDVILGPSRTDFYTYRKLCQLGNYLGNKDLCIDKISFTLQSREMSSQFTTHITVSLIIGLILAFPYAFWEIWRFIEPGLYPNERKNSRGAVFFVTILFLIGVFFGYFIAAPLSINFLASYTVDPSILNEFDLSSYIGTLTRMTLACGIMFELPMIVYFLAKAGIASPELMRLYRRHAIVVILIVAALISPPDVLSMTIFALPLIGLYEVSILIAKIVQRNTLRRLNQST
ncbi:Sec-independent protein translocase protein TatC [Adhaeribacter aerolatus]|uniref:Sec-independent protein translocase protein TatC n=1 Tax=Adhaeribacter aerolatus TaxID=670289 RepID=A0A512B1Z6_9BACT|nr:twin-arginine translocase subunit TatC [Adhaeribacter aerolatus]GEO05984.1 Sec-independent protein translocase protein TatC [Adhaeribacter aerolatus]